MFNGFHRTGSQNFSVRPTNMFAGFPENSSFGGVGGVNNIPGDFVAWFNPSVNITLNSGNVSQWQDITGTYTLLQSTAANQPAYKSDSTYRGYPYLSLNGTTNRLQGTNILGTGTNGVWTAIVIGLSTTLQSCFMEFDSGGNFNTPGFYGFWTSTNGGSQTVDGRNAFTSLADVSITSVNSVTGLFGMEINRSAGFIYSLYNQTWHQFSVAITTTLTNYSTGNFWVGWDSNRGYAPMNILDLLFYNRQLTSTELASIYGYFKGLYGLP